MSLAEQLTDYIHAAFSGLWITTHEPDEAEREIATLARERKWKLAAWDIARGLRFVVSFLCTSLRSLRSTFFLISRSQPTNS